VLSGAESGEAFEPGVRAGMRARLCVDFTGVRVHRGATAERAAASLDARVHRR
jgi:hypothetical protein